MSSHVTHIVAIVFAMVWSLSQKCDLVGTMHKLQTIWATMF